MDTKTTIFQYVIMGILFLCVLGGVAVVALYKGGSDKIYTLSVWGELPFIEVQESIDALKLTEPNTIFNYKEVDSASFSSSLTSALAEGTGPDLVLISASKLYENEFRLVPYSLEVLPSSVFQQQFLPQYERILLGTNGWRALPIAVDPLVLYSNSALLASNSYSHPPKTWQDLAEYIPSLSQFDERGYPIRSAVALGGTSNVLHFKQILSSLFFQSGNLIVNEKQNQTQLGSVLNTGNGSSDSAYVLNHYIQYSNPQKSLYSWNDEKGLDQSEFISGDLVSYIAPASEAQILEKMNPNLIFEISEFPQAQVSPEKAVYADLYVVAITRGAEEKYDDAIHGAQVLSSSAFSEKLSNLLRISPATRSSYPMGGDGQADFMGKPVILSSALISKTWLDPNTSSTNVLFKEMVERARDGIDKISDIIRDTDQELDSLLN